MSIHENRTIILVYMFITYEVSIVEVLVAKQMVS